jgi:phage portal protein BeeE
MFEGLKQLMQIKAEPESKNLLNEMVFQYLNNQDIVWYNNQQSQIFINQGYRQNATVYSIVRKLGDKKKIAPPLVYTEKNRNAKYKYKEYKYSGDPQKHSQAVTMRSKALEFADQSDLAKLLANPNPNQTWTEFAESCAGFYDTCGEVFIYGVGPGEDSKNYGKYTEMYAMPSHLVTLVTGDINNPVKGYKILLGNQTIEIPFKDVLHMKMWNPFWDLNGNQLRGQSPLLAGLRYLKKNDVGVYSSVKLLENRGAETIVSPNHPDSKYWLNPTQVTATEDAIASKVNGSANRGKTVVSAMPLQATQLGLSPQALQIIESMNDDVTTLCGLWGLDPILLGRGTGTYSNQEMARKALIVDIVIPYLNNLEQNLMNWLCPAYDKSDGVKYVIDFDTTVYSELQPDLKLMKEIYGMPSLTEDERRPLFNFDELGGELGAAILVDQGKITLQDVIMPNDDAALKDAFGDYS